MSFLNANFATPALVFIPNLLKPPAVANNTRGNLHPACPTRHPAAQYALIPPPLPSRVPPLAVLSPNPISTSSTSPTIVNVSPPPTVHTFPFIGVTTSQPESPLSLSTPLDIPPSLPHSKPPQRRGHRHTTESRRKIGIANRGNTPWNKGRRHSEETKRKIAENTKRAMLKPEMRQILQQRARGRRHSEATKLKIRETARLTRGTAKSTMRPSKKTPVPYAFSPHVVKRLNDCIAKQIEHSFEQDTHGDGQRYIITEKRVMSKETRQKLSRRIKELWNDPDYRSRVASGVEERCKRLAENKAQISDAETKSAEIEPAEVMESHSPTKRRPRRNAKKKDDDTEQAKPARKQRVGKASANNADIVLDSDSLQGWTKEDLGIIGAHGAGLIDDTILASNMPIESPLPQIPDEGPCRDLDQPLGLDPATNAEIPELYHVEFPYESSDSKLSPISAGNGEGQRDLDFSRLDLATDHGVSASSYSNHTDFLEQQVVSFNHEPLLEGTELLEAGDLLDQVPSGEYFSESRLEKGSHDPFQYTGNDRGENPSRSPPSSLEEGTNIFERF